MSTSLLRRLIERRVPQYLALYIGIGWGFLQFMVFLQDTFLLSPEWTKLALLALALLVPSVILFSYFHGRPGRDRWMRFELIGIPLNVLVALVVLFIEFGGKDLGAQVEKVTVRDETGQAIERAVPKSQHRKRVAVFYFDGTAGDTATWLRYGVPTALVGDLMQDIFVDLRFGPFFRDRLREAGYRDELNVPLPLKREIARDLHLGYVVSGTVRQEGASYTAQAALHDATSAKLIGEWTFTETSPQALADRLSLEVRKGLGIPGRHIEESADLPVSETLTPSADAFRHFSAAMRAMEVEDDYFAATASLERAVAADPTFANAHYALYASYLLINQAAKAMPSLQAAMDHLYRMPERVQNVVKFEHYFMTRQQDKAYAVAQLNTELYPDDIRSLQLLAQIQVLRGDRDGAIGSLRRMLELDPQQAEALQQIGDLYQGKGALDTALSYFAQYAERFPLNRESFVRLGDLQAQRGQVAEAKRDYEKALLLEPNAVPVLLKLADLERNQGRLAEARSAYERALGTARTAQDSALALGTLQRYYERRGQFRRALEYRHRAAALTARTQPPFSRAINELTELGLYVRAGQPETAERRLRELRTQLVAPMDLYLPLGDVEIAVEREQLERAERAIAAAEQMIRDMGLQVLAAVPVRARAEVHRRRREWDAALTQYRKVLELAPADVGARAHLAECYRELGQLDRALAEALAVLRIQPAHPHANLEAGLVELRRGRKAEARRYLQQAVDVWQEADPGFPPAAKAREALAAAAGSPRT